MAKKTKKFDTPIDQRETFVSIQKTFADSDLSVAEKLKTLYALQQADTEIDKILQLRGELPLEVENLEREIAELKAKSARVSEHIEEMTRLIAENKLNISECDAQIEKYKSQLDNISNSREYDSLNKEIENQGLLRMIAEKHIGEAKERILDKKAELETIKEKIAVRTDDLAAKQEELEAREYDIKAGGGAVSVKINGKKEVTEIVISPDLVDPDDTETLCDVLIAAVNEAIKTVETNYSAEMEKITGKTNFNIPGLM